MRKIIITFAVLISFASSDLWAQFSLSGEFRPRLEYRDGYQALKTEGTDAALVISQRTRLTADYQQDWLKTRISFQDIRLWGNDDIVTSTGMFGNRNSQALFEAWAEMSFLSNSSIRIGRQEFDYDDSRILSGRNWNNNGLSYDALLYQYVRSGWEFDLVLSYNNIQDNRFGNDFPEGRMRSLNFLRLNRQFNPHFSGSIIAIASGFMREGTSETMYMKGTYGLNMVYKRDAFDMFGSYYHQNGKHRDGTDVLAWNLNAEAKYRLDKLSLKAGFSLISGDDADEAKLNAFDLLYGARHKFYGHMDYFNNLPVATRGGGLNNIYAGFGYQLSAKTTLLIDYHHFSLNRAVLDNANEELEKPLGSELDLALNFRLGNTVNLRGGYGIMLPAESLEILNTGFAESEFSSWAWLMLTIKPVFFSVN